MGGIMKVANRNKVAEISVNKEYIDSEYILWEYRAKVQINSSYEVMESTIEFLEGFDLNGEIVNKEDNLTPSIVDEIKVQAERIALENIESVDFEREDERE